MDHHSIRLQALFSQYLQRRCTPAEVEELTGLLQQADAEEVLTEPMRVLWEELKGQPIEYPVDWDKMYERVSRTEEDLYQLNRRRIHPFHRTGWRVAAAVLALVVVSAVYWMLSGRERGLAGKKDMAVRPVAGSHAGGVTSVEGTAPADKRRVIHLPDGSTVMLNRNSTLNYPTVFTGATREVRLSGEAYFDISRQSGHPFLVHTGRITTRVLGTAFNIRAYPADPSIEVTVTHGKVQVLEENKSMGMLTDDQQIRFDKSTEGYVQKKIDTRPVVAWKPHEIRFDDITMEEAARGLEQRFGVTVGFTNPVLKDCRVTATFYEDDALEEIMTVICVVSQSDFTIKDRVVTIDGRGCN